MSNALSLADYYKTGHHKLMPENTTIIYSNSTPRQSRDGTTGHVVVFGLQYFIKKYLINKWNDTFFNVDKDVAIKKYSRLLSKTVGPNVINEDNLAYLHDLGYLPLRFKALPEGSLCPIQVPYCTIVNTDDKCAWLTNYLETLLQTVTWFPIVSATTSFAYRCLLDKYAEETSSSKDPVQFQAHDFSMRGMTSVESCEVSGMAHLTSFVGTDTMPAIETLEEYYNADIDKELVGCSVWATEHSIMQGRILGYKEDSITEYYNPDSDQWELNHCGHKDTVERTTSITDENRMFYGELVAIDKLIDSVPENEFISIVSDTYDFFRTISEILPKLKTKIMSRSGRVIMRPDSGDPVHIICGYKAKNIRETSTEFLTKLSNRSFHEAIFTDYTAVHTSDGVYLDAKGNILSTEEYVGAMKILYSIFGGTKNSKGYKELDPHIGLIYGDSITYTRCKKICQLLKEDRMASTNVVFGIGSFTYQYVTRDTYGIAQKCTYTVINGEPLNVYKSPKTGGGRKKSAKGLLRVDKIDNEYRLKDEVTPEQEAGGELQTVFENGKLVIDLSLNDIRNRLSEYRS